MLSFCAVRSVVLWEECGDYYCFNGATCQNDTCQCAEGFGGDYCLYSEYLNLAVGK